VNDPALDHEYLPITGLPEFTSAAAKLILGADSAAINEQRASSVQTISGTGANHLGALFLSRFYQWDGLKQVYLSNPTWGTLSVRHDEGALTPRCSEPLPDLPQRGHRAH
jgi:aspartate aminotransferase, cytoplasmic